MGYYHLGAAGGESLKSKGFYVCIPDLKVAFSTKISGKCHFYYDTGANYKSLQRERKYKKRLFITI